MWIASCPEAMDRGLWVIFEKKKLVAIWSWTKWVDFRASAKPGQLGLRDAPRVVGSDGTVSIVEIVSLSPRVEKPKSQEGNKSFVPELPRVVSVSSVFRDSYACERFTYPYVLQIHTFYETTMLQEHFIFSAILKPGYLVVEGEEETWHLKLFCTLVHISRCNNVYAFRYLSIWLVWFLLFYGISTKAIPTEKNSRDTI